MRATKTIVSREVASASTWLRPRKMVSAGTKRRPPPTPIRPPARPPTTAKRIAIRTSTLSPPRRSWHDQLDRDHDQEEGEDQRHGPFGDALLERGAQQDAGDRGDRQPEAGAEVDVAVDAALGKRAEQADEDDRGEAGPRGQ